ncbi:MAG: glycosyltransferase family 4 protein [Candidatus Doudnabacteria bacterium]|nr:glycosyltransferase family 4 protein [Candidatus Doudnabacteria bacterium]
MFFDWFIVWFVIESPHDFYVLNLWQKNVCEKGNSDTTIMHVIFTNAVYREKSTDAGGTHVREFIANAVNLGHEIWLWDGQGHPATHPIPATRIGKLRTLRNMDVVYTRVEDRLPDCGRWAVAPYRQLIGSPLIVWEFNTVPEFGALLGRTEREIQSAIQAFKRYGRGCDLAICVSRELAAYVKEKLGIRRVLIVPNGSDPKLFRPDVEPVSRVQRQARKLNVVWIGSAYLSWHNFDLLGGAARILWERCERTQIVFHIIGQDFRSMGDMPPNVHYYGRQDYETLPRWLAAMDVGLCLYRPGPADFSSPVKVFDYMASGLMVVGSCQPQLREIFNKLDQPDLLVPPDDPVALADVLAKAAQDPERVRRQGDASRQLVLDYYNWERSIRDTFREIEIIFEEKNRRRHAVLS